MEMEYEPIDYPRWDMSGQGRNIASLLTEDEDLLWKTAFIFQDTRKGENGHGEVVTYFALKLLPILGGERGIAVPAAILHDTGWSQLSETERTLFYEEEKTADGKAIWERYEPVLRARHQEEGVRLARRLLEEQKYKAEFIPHIIEIISQHDTRKGFYSLEDGVVRDADKLWRFTFPCLKLAMRERSWTVDELKKRYDEWTKQEGFFSDNRSREIAKIEAENNFDRYFHQK